MNAADKAMAPENNDRRSFASWCVEYLIRAGIFLVVLFGAFVGAKVWMAGLSWLQTAHFAEATKSFWLIATPIMVVYALGVALYETIRKQ